MKQQNSVSEIFTRCLKRDGYTCCDCGVQTKLEIHHIRPVSQGGTNTLSNLKTVCSDCHKNNYKDVHYPKDKSVLIPHEQRVKTRYGIDKTKNTQILITFPDEMVDEIETHWHENKLKNRNEAIRDLIEKGLKLNK
ncbi:hypothetical protein JCM9140_3148 [Halalkalibacter wakoensis JCM 9140]|uniref:HNH nuclease domain-containing protein n=1 Tax=Halalkalibacter wakoensis JCM 9140 TaxID=1236970 RepID=W4Q4M8_9BACI|nr:ribbon-helix-helix domain-containing protein [Halalkalibacter wakoensis]GAE27036.1 hypothetical protein JCM9140_3148 [Halalkalibacter wakoensis JCM 9140]